MTTTMGDVDKMIARLQANLATVSGASSTVASASQKTDIANLGSHALALLMALRHSVSGASFSTTAPAWNSIMEPVFKPLTEKMSPVLKTSGVVLSDLGCCQYGAGGQIECTEGQCADLQGTFTPGPCPGGS